RRGGAARFDDARGGRGAGAPLPDARCAGVAAGRDLRRDRVALAERPAAREAGDGRRARARSGEGRLAASAAARGGGCVLDPRRAGRADVAVTIVEDIRERGDEAVREWALRLDGAEPERAVAEPELLPREALLALADRVRR